MNEGGGGYGGGGSADFALCFKKKKFFFLVGVCVEGEAKARARTWRLVWRFSCL